MILKIYNRSAHKRHYRNGKISSVPATMVHKEIGERRKTKAYVRKCPHCSAQIRSTRMPNGGWGHFETEAGLSRVKHACLHRGLGYSKKRCPITPDLFGNVN